MAYGVFHLGNIRFCAVTEKHLYRIGDGALFRVQVIAGVVCAFHDFHFVAQRVDHRVAGMKAVFVVVGTEISHDQGHGNHVLQAMVTVRRVGEWPLFGNDADG